MDDAADAGQVDIRVIPTNGLATSIDAGDPVVTGPALSREAIVPGIPK
jgi:hypothetical protein